MTTSTKKEAKKLFSDRDIEKFRVRSCLIVKLTEEKTFTAGELVELTQEQYLRHAHQVETDEQFQARQKSSK